MSFAALDPAVVVKGYTLGLFPMSESKEDASVFWVEPENRGVLPLDGFHASRSLLRTIRKGVFDVTFDTAFREVMLACADREETWINAPILDAYCALFECGLAHSVECRQNGKLVGGLYGVALGGAFFGESMFSKVADASKVALHYLVERLKKSGFSLLDTQFLTPHLARLGGIEIPQKEYLKLLNRALSLKASF